ncbi:MAG: DUF6273 domain-containing protein [Leptospirales bacterium]|nr:DUF6273 domain-containing protein [Leptospirales bacterium]
MKRNLNPVRAVEVKSTGAVGNTGEKIKFGKWDWLVLERRDNMSLIITDKIVERREYNKVPVSMWEGSKLQKYLNGEFLEKNFSSQEREQIICVENVSADNPPNQWYNEDTIAVKSGKNASGIVYNVSHIGKSERTSKNHLFLLSLEEVCRYFGDSREKLNSGNYKIDGWEYVPVRDGVKPQKNILDGEGVWWFSDKNDKNRIALELTSNKAWNWWLRSAGMERSKSAAIYPDGSVNMAGGHDEKLWGIRPALWLRTGDGPVVEEYVDPDIQTVPKVSPIAADIIPAASDLIGKWGIGGMVTVEFINETSMVSFGNTYTIEFSGNTMIATGIAGSAFALGQVKFLMNSEKNAVKWSEGTITFMGWNGQVWNKME